MITELRLSQKQELFMRLLPQLINYAHQLGYEIRGGELLRSEESARWNADHCRTCGKTKEAHPTLRGLHGFKPMGIVNSLHIKKLAIDLNLFRHGVFCTTTEDHRPLGEFWKTLNPLCCWGGDFGDGNHYSITHGGKK